VTGSNPLDALRRYEVATRNEWLDAGISAQQFRTLVDRGHLIRLRYGAYGTAEALAAGEQDDAHAHALRAGAVIARTGRTACVASHESAALVQDLRLLTSPGTAVTITREPDGRTRGRKTADLTIRVAHLPDSDVRERYGIRVTAPARTVVDLARTLPFIDAVVVADDAVHNGRASKATMRRILSGCSGWPKAASVARVIDFSDGNAESPLESAARVMFHAWGLPAPELQVTIPVADGGYFIADFCWPEYRTIAETDGMLKYDQPDQPDVMRKQFRRDRLLRDRGYKVVHITWDELFNHPEVVRARIRKAFATPSAW
jgi:hypothetical protein